VTRPPDSPESIARNAGFALATQATASVFAAVLTIFLARYLGPERFGVFSLAVGIAAVLVLPGDAGISSAAARFIAERRGNPAAVARVLRDASRLRLITSGTVCIALVIAAGPLADAYDEPTLAWTLRGMALAIFGQNLMQLYGSSFTALGRVSLSFRASLLKSIVELSATLGLVLAGAGSVGAAFGRSAGFLAGGILGAWMIWRLVGSPRDGDGDASPLDHPGIRNIARYAGALVIVEGAFVMFEQIDVILIGAILTASAAGLFQAALRLTTFLHYPAYALASGIAPRVARHEVEGPAVETFALGLRGLVVFQAALIAPIVIWAGPIVDLVLGDAYDESAEVLRALAPYVFLAGLGPLVSMAVNYAGEARRRVPIALGALAVNAVIDVILIPEIGIVAGAIGTDVAYAIYVPAHLWICKDMLGVDLRPILVSFARALVAAAAMAGVLALFGTEDVGILALIAGSVAGLAVYLAVLLALRELTVGDLRRLAAEARARLLASRA
jgi:O-antigen/teichoic acid export membrane protein